MARVRLGGTRTKSAITKWRTVEVGTRFEARSWSGLRQGKDGFDPLFDLVLVDGAEGTFPAPTVLRRQLAQLTPGAPVTITYCGPQISERSGREFLDFVTEFDAKDRVHGDDERREAARTTRAAVNRVQRDAVAAMDDDEDVPF